MLYEGEIEGIRSFFWFFRPKSHFLPNGPYLTQKKLEAQFRVFGSLQPDFGISPQVKQQGGTNL